MNLSVICQNIFSGCWGVYYKILISTLDYKSLLDGRALPLWELRECPHISFTEENGEQVEGRTICEYGGGWKDLGQTRVEELEMKPFLNSSPSQLYLFPIHPWICRFSEKHGNGAETGGKWSP